MTEPLFDPDKVTRLDFWWNSDEGDKEIDPTGDYVLYDDYSKLLSLYRELQQERESVES